ncbi:hypothetical protein CPB86DRAFT_698875 [Serendipita vermifera]|nr:hypothetical protein CPB86DRAFT_698875 [Serendipita vermifera]
MEKVDILILGATGYTGTLITEYLERHANRQSFSLGVAGRSLSKLQQLSQKFSTTSTTATFTFDVSDYDDICDTVKKATVVINCIGPFSKYSTPIVRACAENGIHYVDISGEPWWQKELLNTYDYLAMKTKTIIIPCTGVDSIPRHTGSSDLAVYLSARALQKKQPLGLSLGSSVTGIDMMGSFSGGTLATTIHGFENMPKSVLQKMGDPYYLSPVRGVEPQVSLYTRIPHTKFFGGVSVMGTVNTKVVNRTWGLLEAKAVSAEHSPPNGEFIRYGRNFRYEEYSMWSSPIVAMIVSLGVYTSMAAIALLPPLRWFLKKFGPQPGTGPNDSLDNPRWPMTYMNVTATDSPNPDYVKTTIKFKTGAYATTAVTCGESALTLLFDRDQLPAVGKDGGIVTPMSGLGDCLVKRLLSSGYITYDTHTLVPDETRKRV